MSVGEWRLTTDDLSGPEIARFLQAHVDEMRALTPPHSAHALDLDGLRRPEVTFWTVLEGVAIAGCGALKELDPSHGEIKSMRTAAGHQRRGVASVDLRHIVDTAVERGYSRLSLETGSFAFFGPARAFYARYGFTECGPFGDYRVDPNSTYMTQLLPA